MTRTVLASDPWYFVSSTVSRVMRQSRLGAPPPALYFPSARPCRLLSEIECGSLDESKAGPLFLLAGLLMGEKGAANYFTWATHTCSVRPLRVPAFPSSAARLLTRLCQLSPPRGRSPSASLRFSDSNVFGNSPQTLCLLVALLTALVSAFFDVPDFPASFFPWTRHSPGSAKTRRDPLSPLNPTTLEPPSTHLPMLRIVEADKIRR